MKREAQHDSAWGVALVSRQEGEAKGQGVGTGLDAGRLPDVEV
jgi:hypothetical protein